VSKDLPDYTRQVTIKYTGGFIGLEELAARLRSPVPWDLRGNIILAEDFETEETEWTLTTVGVGSAAVRQSRHKFSGDWAVKLVAGDEEDAFAAATRQIYHPGAGKLAIFGRIAWDEDLQRWLFGLMSELDGIARYAWVRYTLPTTTLEVYTGAGGWGLLSDSLEIDTGGYVFHPILITLDLTTGSYEKLVLDDEEYDLSTYALGSAMFSPGPYLEAGLYAYAVEDTGCTIYGDDIVIAKNLP